MKNDSRGFTLIELLTVLLILGILMAIAVPSIMTISARLKERGLKSKIEAIQEAAVIYTQNNSNKIKSKLGGTCIEDNDHCECAGKDKDGNPTDCKYIFTLTVDDLIEVGAYKTEKSDGLDTTCDVEDPRDSKYCLDCVKIKVSLDDDYKNATAELKMEDITDKTTTCTKSAIIK